MIEAEGLSKNYGSFTALKDVSFGAGFPGIFGLLGPNGAGKTTLLKILTGYHAPSGGRLKIDGLFMEDSAREIKTRIGYLPENNPLYGDMTPLEYIKFAAEARLLQKEKKRNAVNNVIESCGLESCLNKRIDTLSKGFRQRTGLACALIHDPPLLILDEPTSGLDPNQISGMRSFIKELGKRKTIIISTHILHEAEALCSVLMILNKGRVAARGSSAEIAAAQGETVIWELAVKGENIEKIRASLEMIKGKFSLISVLDNPEGADGGTVKLKLASAETEKNAPQSESETIFDWAVSEKLKILELNKTKSSLEDVFSRLTGVENGSGHSGENEEPQGKPYGIFDG